MSTIPENTVEFLRKKAGKISGVISTGSGQALSFREAGTLLQIDYDELPGYDDAGLSGHAGELSVVRGQSGVWAIWTGRRHFYQGYSYRDITAYIDISKQLGADTLICINSAGGLNPELSVGDIRIVQKFKCFIPVDAVEYSPDGGTWRDTSTELVTRLMNAAEKAGIDIDVVNYAGVPGPTYETAAEVKWLRSLGCDVVGMSTVPELIRAGELGMKAVAVSAIANVHGSGKVLTHEEVVTEGKRSTEKIQKIIETIIGIK